MSVSSQESKSRGLYRCDVLLSLLDSSDQQESFIPTEAWLEDIHEYYNSVAIKKRLAGVRLCVLFEKRPGVLNGGNIQTRASINSAKGWGSRTARSDAVTYGFLPGDNIHPTTKHEFPTTGQLSFTESETQKKVSFRYSIPQ
jgi:hypothetical protein